ncbi:MAG: hypothetical protein U0271_24315 [Polyangiaceae bacterium]
MIPSIVLPMLAALVGCAASGKTPGGGASERIEREPARELTPATIELAARPAIATRVSPADRERHTEDLRSVLASAKRNDPPKCEEYTGLRCYWMENTSGNYCWVPATWARDKVDCHALDSCDGGLGQSGGGCYKWAAGTSAPRHPW